LAGAIVAYGLNELAPVIGGRSRLLPYVSASKVSQTYQAPRIEIGLSAAPVTVDGMVTAAEYIDSEDTNPYTYLLRPPTKPPFEGYLRGKYEPDLESGLTYFGIDIPASVSHPGGSGFFMVFDTKNSGSQAPYVDGLYSLLLQFQSSSLTDQPKEIDSVTVNPIGTPFRQKFSKGVDYDWKYYFGSSPIDDNPHSQFEVAVRNRILRPNSKETGVPSSDIGFASGYSDAKGMLTIPDFDRGDYARLVYKEEKLAEPFSLLGLGIAGSALAAKLVRKRMSRRNFLGIG